MLQLSSVCLCILNLKPIFIDDIVGFFKCFIKSVKHNEKSPYEIFNKS